MLQEDDAYFDFVKSIGTNSETEMFTLEKQARGFPGDFDDPMARFIEGKKQFNLLDEVNEKKLAFEKNDSSYKRMNDDYKDSMNSIGCIPYELNEQGSVLKVSDSDLNYGMLPVLSKNKSQN